MNTKKYNATIYYTMKSTHPDIKYIDPELKYNVFKYNDIYTIQDRTIEGANDYISHDLKLIAGGGYNTKHIANITITINQEAQHE